MCSPLGGAVGGLLVGAIVKLLGIDAFNLLFGQSPGDVTGALEGIILGGAVGFGAWFASVFPHDDTIRGALSRVIGISILTGAGAGVIIGLLDGCLMIGSLELLVRQFSGSRLRFDQVGHFFGEDHFGQTAQIVTGGLEGALFAGCIVGVLLMSRVKTDSNAW